LRRLVRLDLSLLALLALLVCDLREARLVVKVKRSH
jgi:hypothetical protein